MVLEAFQSEVKMSFVKIPNKIHYGSKSITDHYTGIGDDNGTYIFKVPTNESGSQFTHVKLNYWLTYVFTDSEGLTWEDAEHETGGEPCFQASNGWMLYYVPSLSKWIMMQNASWWGYIPRTTAESYTDPDTHVTEYTYNGDIWWEATSLNTMPWNGAVAGTFTFGLDGWSSRYTDLSVYEDVTHTLSGDVGNPKSLLVSGSGPTGIYDDNTYVGFPEWNYTYQSRPTTYITHYGDDDGEWANLTRYRNIRYVDEHYLTTRWSGWVASDILGAPNAETNRGFYATPDEPQVQQNFTLKWYHFVPDDPDDPESDGIIQHDTSWTDDGGVVHQMPDVTVTWVGVQSEYGVHVPLVNINKRIAMAEAAIWR